MPSPLITLGLRGAQALFGIVVLGLSVTLICGHHWGRLPAGLGYGAFAGGLSFVAALIGLAATWFDFLGAMTGLVIDGIVALVNIAGGILFAIKLNGVECKDFVDPENLMDLLLNEWFNGGYQDRGNRGASWVWAHAKSDEFVIDTISGHCREARADTVFMFLTAVVIMVCALLVWLRMRKGY